MIDARIYAVCPPGKQPVLGNDLFSPLHIGSVSPEEDNNEDLPAFCGDAGDHIAHYYERWGDLTALYWVWKNTSHDYVGMAQRRRYLSLSGGMERDHAVPDCSEAVVKRNRWTLKSASSFIIENDVICPRAYSIEELTIAKDLRSPWQFYRKEGGNPEDIDELLRIIKEKYPDIYIHGFEFVYGNKMIPWNIFLMKRDIFDGYCNFIFSILFEFEKIRDISSTGSFQRNIWGLVAEILGNIYLNVIRAKDPQLVFHNAPIIYVEGSKSRWFNRRKVMDFIIEREKNTSARQPKAVLYGGRVNIVLSFDDHYVGHFCAVLNSIMAHTANIEDILVFVAHDENLSFGARQTILSLYGNRIALSFLEINSDFVHYFPLNRSHITVNSYYRLLLHNILPKDIRRVIYLDTDIIVCDDIVDLWNTDMQGHGLAGVPDEMGIVESYRLFGKGFEGSYINAGVFLMDIEKVLARYKDIDFLYVNSFYKYRDVIELQDQDILNIAYRDDMYILPLRWNMPSSSYEEQRDITPWSGCEDSPEHIFSYEEDQMARLDPAILHYTGKRKPWKPFCLHYLKEAYWHYYMQTQGVRMTFSRYLARWNYYFNVRRGTVNLYLYGREYAWPVVARLAYWRRIFRTVFLGDKD